MPEDCLICFRKLRPTNWTPPLTCACRPKIHRTCWETWTDHIGYQTCVICRFPEAPLPDPPQAAAIILFEPQHPPRRRLEDIATVVGVFFLIWFMMIIAAPRSVNINLPPPSLQQQTWMKEEL